MSTLNNIDLAEGQTYYVRLIANAHPSTDSGTVSWSSTSRTAPFTLTVLADLASTPGWLKVSLANGPDDDPVDFTIDGGSVIFSAVLDPDGNLVATSVPIASLSVGSHTVTATTATGAVASGTFNVTGGAVSYPAGAAADNAATFVSQSGVVKWILQDPQAGGTSYLFPINPNRMSAPQTPRVYNAEHTTAIDGQSLVFEGASIATTWTVEGDVLTQAFYEKLEWFNNQPRRLYLIDHLSRAWTVTCEHVEWTAKRVVNNPWAHHYRMTLLIHAGPVQLP